MIESDYTMSKMILDELLRTKSIPRKDYNAICKNKGLIEISLNGFVYKKR